MTPLSARPALPLVLLVLLALAHLFWTLAGAPDEAWRPYLGNLVYFPQYALSALLTFRAARRHTGGMRTAWSWITAGILMWGLGQVAYTLLYVATGVNPFPSVADVGYLALIPCFVIGLWHFPRPRFERLQTVSFLLDIAIVVIAVGEVLWDFDARATVQSYADRPFPLAVALAYPAADLALCGVLLALTLWRPRRLSARQLGLLAAGLGVFLAGDLAYAFQSSKGLYVLGQPLDSLWMWGAVLFGAAAVAPPRPSVPPADAPDAPAVGPLVANAAIVCAYALYFLAHQTEDALGRGIDGAVTVVTLLVVARQVTGLLDNHGLHRRLARQARHDALTGLLHRSALRMSLDRVVAEATRSGRPAAVLFVDLDRMKLVNDSFGHPFGDRVLREIADRIAHEAGRGALVARAGGDEFIVVPPGPTDERAAAALAERLLRAVSRPLPGQEQEFYLTASVGIALCPGDTTDPDMAIRLADAAMGQAKRRGKNTFRFHGPEPLASAAEQLRLDARLRLALAREEFDLHYQPLVRLADGRTVGYEALLRWTSPDLGSVPPLKFIPVAEEHGLIHALGAFALRRALGQVRRWREGGADVYVAVNASALQFAREDYVDEVRAALAEHGLPGEALLIELTESALITDLDASVAKLGDLRALGVRVALDDFGTGYSSLSYLERLPVQVLKMDRSFVTRTGDTGTAFVRAVVTMARSLKLTVVAEGIEDAGQAEALRALGCDLGQGYALGRPGPAEVWGERGVPI